MYENSLIFSPDSNYILIGGFQRVGGVSKGAVRVLQMPSGMVVRQFLLNTWVAAVWWTPDLKTIGAGCGQEIISDAAGSEIHFWDAASAKAAAFLPLRGFTVRSLALSPNGSLFAIGGVREGSKRLGQVLLWNRAGKQVGALTHSDQVWSVAFSPDGKTLATGSGQVVQEDWGKTDVRLWSVQTQTMQFELNRPHGTAQSGTVFSPDGKWVASGDGPEGDVLIWETRTGKLFLNLKGHSGAVYALAFSPNGKWLATGSRDSTVRLWDVPSGVCVAVLKEHKTAVHAVAFAPNGILATGDIDKALNLWKIG